MPNRQGSIRLFRFLGVEVFLHWSWFLIAVFEIESRAGKYSSILWNVLEYLALFGIVLTHEYGHALACRQVGGQANRYKLGLDCCHNDVIDMNVNKKGARATFTSGPAAILHRVAPARCGGST